MPTPRTHHRTWVSLLSPGLLSRLLSLPPVLKPTRWFFFFFQPRKSKRGGTFYPLFARQRTSPRAEPPSGLPNSGKFLSSFFYHFLNRVVIFCSSFTIHTHTHQSKKKNREKTIIFFHFHFIKFFFVDNFSRSPSLLFIRRYPLLSLLFIPTFQWMGGLFLLSF